MAYTFRHGDRPLDGVTVQRAVGRGGFGEVYYALTDSGKEIALKYLRENPEIELRGVRQVMNLKSPHLVKIYDVRRDAADEPFILMEYVSGPSLRDVLRLQSDGLPPEQAVFFACGIAQGLSYLHEHGIVHRDLKPGNIFYDDGYVKIGDYGLSKHMSISQHSGQTVSVGTVHYMAPEIGSGRYTRLVDIYALGVILYEMLAGRQPFVGASIQEVLVRQLRDEPDTSLLPPGFAPIVAKALAKAPEDRYQDAQAMADALVRLPDVSRRLTRLDPLALSAIPRSGKTAADEPAHATPRRAAVSALDIRQAVNQDRTREPYEVEPPYRERHRAPSEKSFNRPLGMLVAFTIMGALLGLVEGALGGSGAGPFGGLRKLLFVAAAVSAGRLLYKWWSTLPPGWRRTSPGKAVGFCFIPLFNLYWILNASHGLIADLNRYSATFAPGMRRLSHRWLIAFWALFVLAGATLDHSEPGVMSGILMSAAAAAAIVVAISITGVCQDLIVDTRVRPRPVQVWEPRVNGS